MLSYGLLTRQLLLLGMPYGRSNGRWCCQNGFESRHCSEVGCSYSNGISSINFTTHYALYLKQLSADWLMLYCIWSVWCTHLDYIEHVKCEIADNALVNISMTYIVLVTVSVAAIIVSKSKLRIFLNRGRSQLRYFPCRAIFSNDF